MLSEAIKLCLYDKYDYAELLTHSLHEIHLGYKKTTRNSIIRAVLNGKQLFLHFHTILLIQIGYN